MAISDGHRRRRCAAALALVVFAATAALGTPGFIAASQVSEGAVYTEVTLSFHCRVHVLGHDPDGSSDFLRVRLEPTTACTGAPPSVAQTRQVFRPPGADGTVLESVEYDGELAGAEHLRLNFTDDVRVDVRHGPDGRSIVVRIFRIGGAAESPRARVPAGDDAGPGRPVRHHATGSAPRYAINIETRQSPPAPGDLPDIELDPGRRLYVDEIEIDGQTWFRVRIGYYDTAAAAATALDSLRRRFAGAWIDRAAADDASRILQPLPRESAGTRAANVAASASGRDATLPATPAHGSDVDGLMADARHAMTAGELSRAIRIYTKVLQLPSTEHHRQAREYLALARERNGQIAHAKAEYERYLQSWPDGDGAGRVRQRLRSLLAAPPAAASPTVTTSVTERQVPRTPSEWKIRTFWSQYYRRDVNQFNDRQEIVSQSALYTNASVDLRRRGERFDFSARVTGGYRNDLLGDEEGGAGNDLRLSYAYADIADARTHLRGRVGRQSRNSGGVLGRFDGLNLGFSLGDSIELETVIGRPVYSTSTNDPLDRRFYGVSANFAPLGDGFDLGIFYLAQQVQGMTDRNAIGAELRYFGDTRTLWGMLQYDPSFSEIGSAFLQGSWRFAGDFTLTGLVDRRYSPYLALGNALVGQVTQDFDTLAASLTEGELRQLALDRSAPTTTVTLGLSRALTPKLQLGVNATRSSIDATNASAGIEAIPSSEYYYYSVDLAASSLLREGDVSIIGLRQSATSTTDILTISLDTRIPLGRAWRIGPRLRVDQREIRADGSNELTYTPGFRVLYRRSQRARFELDAGKAFSSREFSGIDEEMDRESYYVNLGYQLFF